jgi:hypothetical protein
MIQCALGIPSKDPNCLRSFRAFPFPTHEITSQVISFRLPGVYLTELTKKDTTNKYVKEILAAFEKNGWRTTQLK